MEALYMTYDSPLSAFEGEVIPEVATQKKEGLVTPKVWDWEKWKSTQAINKVRTYGQKSKGMRDMV